MYAKVHVWKGKRAKMEDGIGQEYPLPIPWQVHSIKETLNFSRKPRQLANSILENGLVDQREISRQLRETRTPSSGDEEK